VVISTPVGSLIGAVASAVVDALPLMVPLAVMFSAVNEASALSSLLLIFSSDSVAKSIVTPAVTVLFVNRKLPLDIHLNTDRVDQLN
jgi:hypothetical protein